jgi:post-segregation antitoxin (ccd killing protein)
MPKVNVYLPDQLHEQVRSLGISLSPICQRALQEEVERMNAVAEMRAAGNEESYIAAAARRLAESKRLSEQRNLQKGWEFGRRWAAERAEYHDLEWFAREDPDQRRLRVPVDLLQFLDEVHGDPSGNYSWVMENLDDPALGIASLTLEGSPFAAGLLGGARDVWEAVQPKLADEELAQRLGYPSAAAAEENAHADEAAQAERDQRRGK